MGQIIHVNDRMQSDYRYELSVPEGQGFAPGFKPHLSPRQMLAYGVFEGQYMNDCQGEFPALWFIEARLSDTPDPAMNCFGVKSRQSLTDWRTNGWIIGPDPRGWFQWYCRHYRGRRLAEIDAIQIKRWRAFARHAGQVRKHCKSGDLTCRPRQRQALLQWAYDAFM